MRNSVIIVDIKDNELYAYDEIDINIRNYSDVEKKALLKEFLYLQFDSITINDTDELTCIYGNEKIIFKNYSKLCKLQEFERINEYIEKEKNKLIREKQKNKLKGRKNNFVTRAVILGLATIISLPCMINITRAESKIKSSNVSYTDIKKDEYSLDELGTNVLQGVCTVGKYTFITAYDSSKDKENSVVYVINENKECIREVKLYNNSHVGGICYDQTHEIFWITDKGGTISGYSFNSIFYSREDIIEPIFKKIDVGSKDLINHQGNPSAAYITCHDNKIYVGNFSTNGNGILKSFDIQEDGNININSENKIKFIDKVQGITFYEKNGESYLLVSSSYGKTLKSDLKIFKFDEECNDYSKKEFKEIKMQPMMEQISFNVNGELVTLYESNAQKYKIEKNMQSNDVIIVDIFEKIEYPHI